MRIIAALVGAGLFLGVATAVIAQTAPETTNPNTKVYSYKQTAPAKKAHTEIQQSKADETPSHGSPKWWELQGRYGNGVGGP
jgi:hypothetical protein